MNISKITQNFVESFPGDLSKDVTSRQTPGVLYSLVEPFECPNPSLVLFNDKLSKDIGLGSIDDKDKDFLFGKTEENNIQSYATAYAGHQFGSWAGQLGDGRVIFAGEIENSNGVKTELQWKGLGRTPYSRNGDGKAVFRSSVREYLMSEAMFHLGVPTTRALSLSFTGEKVARDIFYDGKPAEENGAVIMRTAESFLRFGHFELVSAQRDFEQLKKLADFTISRYFPEVEQNENKYKQWFKSICEKTANLIVEWCRVGFVHGVMNTDNMSILGVTIDYGPFSMLDEFSVNFTPNTTDLPGRRYAFGNQAQIGQWNLWQLSNALFPLIEEKVFFEEMLMYYSDYYWTRYDEMLCRKFGFDELKEDDSEFFATWQEFMELSSADFTLFFQALEKYSKTNKVDAFEDVFYKTLSIENQEQLTKFLADFNERKTANTISAEGSVELMKKSNPKFILRNYLLYNCIKEVEKGDVTGLKKIMKSLENPYETIFPEFEIKRPSEYDDIAGCSMLSCSS